MFEKKVSKAMFEMIQDRYFDQIETEKKYLKTLWGIYFEFKDKPEQLADELEEFLLYWDECCDCTDVEPIDYKE